MGKVDIRTLRLRYDLCWIGYAVDALYDICEAGPLCDLELHWIDENGGLCRLSGKHIGKSVSRDRMRFFADSGFFERCSVEGWSDEAHTRKVSVVWDPYVSDSFLLLSLYGGVPLDPAEEEIISLIEDACPDL